MPVSIEVGSMTCTGPTGGIHTGGAMRLFGRLTPRVPALPVLPQTGGSWT
jgi:hypothetical protein